jgi:hypothetical protein
MQLARRLGFERMSSLPSPQSFNRYRLRGNISVHGRSPAYQPVLRSCEAVDPRWDCRVVPLYQADSRFGELGKWLDVLDPARAAPRAEPQRVSAAHAKGTIDNLRAETPG